MSFALVASVVGVIVLPGKTLLRLSPGIGSDL